MRTNVADLNFDDRVDITFNESNYQKVLEDGFNDSDEIIIFTYGIDYQMKQKLRELNNDTIVHLVINNITFNCEEHLSSLLPDNFDCKLNLYLCTLNHVKLILTDKYFYYGSANFTSYSNNNFEIGTITKTTDEIITKLKEYLLKVSDVSTLIGYPELLIEQKIDKTEEIHYSVYGNPEKLEQRIEETLFYESHESLNRIKELIEEVVSLSDGINDQDFQETVEHISEELEVEITHPETWEFQSDIDKEKIKDYYTKMKEQRETIKETISNLEGIAEEFEEITEVNLEDSSRDIEDMVSNLKKKSENLSEIECVLEEIITSLDVTSIEERRERLRIEFEARGQVSESRPIIFMPNESIIENINFEDVNPHISKEEIKDNLKKQYDYLENLK